jgi:hypothetical protein
MLKKLQQWRRGLGGMNKTRTRIFLVKYTLRFSSLRIYLTKVKEFFSSESVSFHQKWLLKSGEQIIYAIYQCQIDHRL